MILKKKFTENYINQNHLKENCKKISTQFFKILDIGKAPIKPSKQTQNTLNTLRLNKIVCRQKNSI